MSLKRDALRIFQAGLEAADPAQAVKQALRGFPGGRVWVLGAGKASARMALAAEQVLGARIAGGLINTKDGHLAKLRRVELNECSHPVPDERGVEGAARIAAMAEQAVREDIVLCLISGGASALLPLPAKGITLEEKQETTKLLLACGANIHELNCVRKHISAIKGGQLAKLAAPARVISLLLSDVIGDDLDVIGSGPTVPDKSTAEQAGEILRRYQIWSKTPASVRQRIEGGYETPKPRDPAFRRTRTTIVGSNQIAAQAAVRKAKALGYRTMLLSTFIDGETQDVARVHAAMLKQITSSGDPMKPPCCVISGGETTVVLRGNGLGGRNQEFALSAAIALDGVEGVGVLSGGTDGTDGPTDAAGAFADGRTLKRAAAKGLDASDFLRRNDAYRFFDPLGDLIRTGPTGTNVMDLRVLLAR